MIQIIPTDTCYGLAWEFCEKDYQDIYRLKGRDFSKQLAFLVRDFGSLREYAEITDEQITFLKTYPRPWSVILQKRVIWNLPDFLDKKEYNKISFRVAEVCIYADIRDNIQYPLFLTSANLSGNPESKTLAEARGVFLWIDGVDGGICDEPPSDIFEFGEDNQIIFFRKNSQ